jgi:quinolinate synthetase A subunit
VSRPKAPKPTARQVDDEAARLADAGLEDLGYGETELSRIAELTWRINKLKKAVNAVIPAHVYQRVEIVKGVADFVGDSYKLAKDCVSVDAERIVFCGVRFMAETAKILNPSKEVLLPAKEAGCSLSESIAAKDVRALKARHPKAPVTYISTSAAVKAESDVIVTSANAKKILSWMYQRHQRVIFIPDAYMGATWPASSARRWAGTWWSGTASASSMRTSTRGPSRTTAGCTRASRSWPTPSAARRSCRRWTSSAAPAT